MSLFKKKKGKKIVETPEGGYTPLRKSLKSASLEPVPYKHTEKFIKDGDNPLDFERERISHKSVDWLLKEQRVPAIMADTKLEIEDGKRQYADHIYVCREVLDLEKGELQCVFDMKEAVQKEIEEYDKLHDELVSNSRKYA